MQILIYLILGKAQENDPNLKISRSFMDAIATLFSSTNKMIFEELPLWTIYPTKSRNQLYKAFKDIFEIGDKIFKASNVNPDPRFLNDGASNYFDIMHEDETGATFELSELEKNVAGIELIAAGVDTTSNAAQWVLWCMAQNPDVQVFISYNYIKHIKYNIVMLPTCQKS